MSANVYLPTGRIKFLIDLASLDRVHFCKQRATFVATCHFLSSALADLMLGSRKERPSSEPANCCFLGYFQGWLHLHCFAAQGEKVIGHTDWTYKLTQK